MSTGRTWSEQRFSPLKLINDTNVQRLGLAWFAPLNTYRGVEATPLVIDGVLYNISAWDITTAYDAATGKVLWTYDPKIAPEWARLACCGPVSRGLAAWNGKIYHRRARRPPDRAGCEDRQARLDHADPRAGPAAVAHRRAAHRRTDRWSSATPAATSARAATCPPTTRETGKQTWKFYIVPGDPAKMPEGAASDSIMPMAAKTWTGEWWKVGGGGNDWDAIVYDPKLDLVYFGTGNGSPHPQAFRSPGGGDNLFLCSIVAVNAQHRQVRLALPGGPGRAVGLRLHRAADRSPISRSTARVRQVIMHAPKDGFFYVLDRATGKLISAKNYVPNTWASHIDLKTGRPGDLSGAVRRREAAPDDARAPAAVTAGIRCPTARSPGWSTSRPWSSGWWSRACRTDSSSSCSGQSTLGAGVNNYPELRKQLNAEAEKRDKGYMLAWDPVQQKEAFRIPYPASGQRRHAGDGRQPARAGHDQPDVRDLSRRQRQEALGDAGRERAGGGPDDLRGQRHAIHRRERRLEQRHRARAARGPDAVSCRARRISWCSRSMPRASSCRRRPPPDSIPPPPTEAQPADKVKAGAVLYAQQCAVCHGQNAVGGVKDLRFLTPEKHAEFNDIVLGGKLKKKGMESFKDRLSADAGG